jgi:TPR repeat
MPRPGRKEPAQAIGGPSGISGPPGKQDTGAAIRAAAKQLSPITPFAEGHLPPPGKEPGSGSHAPTVLSSEKPSSAKLGLRFSATTPRPFCCNDFKLPIEPFSWTSSYCSLRSPAACGCNECKQTLMPLTTPERRDMSRLAKVIAMIVATFGAVAAEEGNGCNSREPQRCSAVIEAPGTSPADRAMAFSRRGQYYLQLGQYQRAIRDYDEAIRISPRFAAALNNRAVAYLMSGKPSQGMPDVQQALQIAPRVPHFWATRGQISQWLGDQPGALGDYDAAMRLGGMPWVKLYQCGLKAAGLFDGPIDGIIRPEFRTALRTCVERGSNCDPLPGHEPLPPKLPPDPECRALVA